VNEENASCLVCQDFYVVNEGKQAWKKQQEYQGKKTDEK